jgi:hemerythrin-like domain-containing protein
VNDHPLIQSFTNVHTALRNDLKTLDSTLKRRGKLNKPELERANRWFEFYWTQLAAHHHGEDTYFYPAISKYDANFLPEIELLTQQHHELDHLTEELRATYSRAAQLQDGAELASLAARYAGLIAAMHTCLDLHLAHEEDVLYASISKNIPEKEQADIDQTYIKKVPMKELSLLAPWLMANMTHQQALEMRGKVPWFIRFLNDKFWNPKYKALVATFQL